MPPPFQGRHVVVTGASGALGTAVTNALLEAGAICHLPSRGQESTAGFDAAVLERVKLANGVDPTNERAVVDFYAGLPSLWASIHCIGGFSAGPFTDTLAPDLERLMQANFLS